MFTTPNVTLAAAFDLLGYEQRGVCDIDTGRWVKKGAPVRGTRVGETRLLYQRLFDVKLALQALVDQGHVDSVGIEALAPFLS